MPVPLLKNRLLKSAKLAKKCVLQKRVISFLDDKAKPRFTKKGIKWNCKKGEGEGYNIFGRAFLSVAAFFLESEFSVFTFPIESD